MFGNVVFRPDSLAVEKEKVMSISAIGGSSSSMSGVTSLYDQGGKFKVSAEVMDKMDKEMSSKIMKDQDTNGDGTMSLAESGLTKDQFAKIDADGDGSSSSSELTSALKSKREDMMSKIKQHFDAAGGAGGPPSGPPPGGAGPGGASQEQSSADMLQSLFGDSSSSSEDGQSTSNSILDSLSNAMQKKMQKATSTYQNQAVDLFSSIFSQNDTLATA